MSQSYPFILNLKIIINYGNILLTVYSLGPGFQQLTLLAQCGPVVKSTETCVRVRKEGREVIVLRVRVMAFAWASGCVL